MSVFLRRVRRAGGLTERKQKTPPQQANPRRSHLPPLGAIQGELQHPRNDYAKGSKPSQTVLSIRSFDNDESGQVTIPSQAARVQGCKLLPAIRSTNFTPVGTPLGGGSSPVASTIA